MYVQYKKDQKGTTLTALVAALIVLVLSSVVLNGYFATTVGRIVLNGKFPVDGHVDVLIKNRFGSELKQRIRFNGDHQNTLIRVGTSIINTPLDELVLEFQAPVKANPGLFNIYSMDIAQPLGKDITLAQSQLREYFKSTNFYSESSSVLQAAPETGRAQLTLTKSISSVNFYWFCSVSLFLAFLTWLTVRHSWFQRIPAFSDMRLGRAISSTAEFNTVNGLRGIAALLVLFSHAAPGFFAINMGIAILFVISGFLLSRPFVENPDRIYSWSTVEVYLAKRVRRILPMYYFFIAITYLVTSQFDTAMRNFLFIEASGHLWPMTQIFTFYLCLPFVLLITATLARAHSALPIAALITAAVVWQLFMTEWKPFYNGRYANQFHLFAFLIGVAGSYINYGQLNQSQAWRAFAKRWVQPLSVILLILLVLTVAWSAPIQPPAWAHPLISQFYVKCVLALLIIIFALQLSEAFFTRILSNALFRSVGVIGFSFYLLHGLGIELALNLQRDVFGVNDPSDRSWSLTLIAFCFTYVMSIFTYSYIERPFFGHRLDSKVDAKDDGVASTGTQALR